MTKEKKTVKKFAMCLPEGYHERALEISEARGIMNPKRPTEPNVSGLFAYYINKDKTRIKK